MTKSTDNPELEEKKIKPLDEGDLDILKSYGLGPYAIPSKKLGLEINEMVEKVKKLVGVKESDTGLALPSLWDLAGDKQMMQEQQPLLVARCTKNHQSRLRRGEVHNQLAADRQVRGRAWREGVSDGRGGGHARRSGPHQVPDPDPAPPKN